MLRNPHGLFPFGLSLEDWKMAGYGALALPNTYFMVSVATLAAILVTSSLIVTSSTQAHATSSQVKQPFQRCAP